MAYETWWEQLQQAMTSAAEFRQRGFSLQQLEGSDRVTMRYPVRVPPYYASLIDLNDPEDPLARMALPDLRELEPSPFLSPDPLDEEKGMVVERLIHLYSDRVVLLATTSCAMYCRHCTRKRLVGKGGGKIDYQTLELVKDYLLQHPEIRDVIISGGDPLTLNDRHLEQIVATIRAVPSVEIIRIGTRIPAVLPMRITPSLAEMLSKYHPLFINTHFNHPRELTPQSIAACALLVNAGIPLNNQTVLLAGVNDQPQVMLELCRALLKARIRPYYILQCDLVEGIEHLRTPLSTGIEIMESLRGRLSGLGIPTFVVDSPFGSGKIPVLPNYLVSWGGGKTVLRNFAGKMFAYPDPLRLPSLKMSLEPAMKQGVSGLLCDAFDALLPSPLPSKKRNV